MSPNVTKVHYPRDHGGVEVTDEKKGPNNIIYKDETPGRKTRNLLTSYI